MPGSYKKAHLARLKRQYIKVTLVFYLAVTVIYWSVIHPLFFNWGARPSDLHRKLPGDQFISANSVVSTRAIFIHSSRQDAWPWIAQTGQNRGGFNSYYWLENLFAAKMVNAKAVHPDWQQVSVGDTVYYGKNEFYDRISAVSNNNYYAIKGWTFYLEPVSDTETRLIVRYPSMEIRQRFLAASFYYGLFEPLHFVMETGMMMGIKRHAEEYAKHEKEVSL